MKRHDTTDSCPRCRDDLALTTEWGWIDDETCTATLCCPSCRTEPAYACAAVVVCHAATEREALAGVSSMELLANMQEVS